MLNLPIKILKTIQIEADQATIEFDNIAELVAAWDAAKHVTSRHLVLIVNAASPDAVAKRAVEITINGDAGANYNHQTLTGEAAAADADRQTGVNALFEYPGGTDYPFAIPGTTYANAFGGGTILFPHAFNTVNHKAALALGGAVEDYVSAVVGRWASVAAITSLILAPDTGNFAAGSTFHLGVIDERYLVEEVNLAAPGIITFDNIPQGEGALAVIGYARSARIGGDWCALLINDDEVAVNYRHQRIRGSAAPSAGQANNSMIGLVIGDNATPNAFSPLVSISSQYTKGNQPHILSIAGYHDSIVPIAYIDVTSVRRLNIEPINKLILEPESLPGTNFLAGSLFSLYRVPKRIIERIELTAPQATITFANIPQNFEALILHVYARTDAAAVRDRVNVSFNGDGVDGNYWRQYLYGIAAAVAANRGNNREVDIAAGNNLAANVFGGFSMLLPGYTETDRQKHRIIFGGSSEDMVVFNSQRWLNMAAIITIALTPDTGPNFLAGSVFELEGILKREGLPPSEGEQWGV